MKVVWGRMELNNHTRKENEGLVHTVKKVFWLDDIKDFDPC